MVENCYNDNIILILRHFELVSLYLQNINEIMKMYRRNSAYILLILALLSGMLTSCKSKKQASVGSVYRQEVIIDHKLNKTAQGEKIVEEAMTWLGTPYGYGRCEKGEASDCSGMVLSVYEDVTGIKIPRNSAKQAEFCKKLNESEVMTGDLVFFATGKDPDKISHVGIMVDSNSFIHSSTKKGVIISEINTPYYIRTFKMFGRVPGI